MKNLFLIVLTTLIISFLLTPYVFAEVPHLIRFQGKVTNKDGAPLNGTYSITFRVYDDAAGGALKWSEKQDAVPVNNGIFTVLLGNTTPSGLDLPFDVAYWLSMEVNNDGEMSPRQAITSVGYAMHAKVADSIADVSVIPQGAIIIWTGTSCPEGYSRFTALDGKFLASDSTYNPVAGGSDSHSHGAGTYAVGNHILSIAEMPSHTHAYRNYHSGDAGSGYGFTEDYNRMHSDGNNILSTGGNQPHNHPFSGTSGWEDNRPEFATVLFCQKD